jgi:hypothetical protein
MIPKVILALLAFSACGLNARPQSKQEFLRIHSLIKPQPGESPWRQINWLTSVSEARQRAATENKPILIFTAADGSPLGRT